MDDLEDLARGVGQRIDSSDEDRRKSEERAKELFTSFVLTFDSPIMEFLSYIENILETSGLFRNGIEVSSNDGTEMRVMKQWRIDVMIRHFSDRSGDFEYVSNYLFLIEVYGSPRFGVTFLGNRVPGDRSFDSLYRELYRRKRFPTSEEREEVLNFLRKDWSADDFTWEALKDAVRTYIANVLEHSSSD